MRVMRAIGARISPTKIVKHNSEVTAELLVHNMLTFLINILLMIIYFCLEKVNSCFLDSI